MSTAARRSVIVDCDFERFKPLRIGSDWPPRSIVQRVEPTYPPEAKRRGIEGTVIVRVLVPQTGTVQQVCSTGPKLLRSAAERAAFDWIFDTPRLNGEKVPYVATQLAFNFVLNKRDASSRLK
jgi:TonB family protein